MASAKKIDQIAFMRTKGFMPAMEVSNKLGNDISTVYRWVDDGKVEGMQVGTRRYVKVISLVNHLGLDTARIFGIITDDQAKTLAKAQKTQGSKSAAR